MLRIENYTRYDTQDLQSIVEVVENSIRANAGSLGSAVDEALNLTPVSVSMHFPFYMQPAKKSLLVIEGVKRRDGAQQKRKPELSKKEGVLRLPPLEVLFEGDAISSLLILHKDVTDQLSCPVGFGPAVARELAEIYQIYSSRSWGAEKDRLLTGVGDVSLRTCLQEEYQSLRRARSKALSRRLSEVKSLSSAGGIGAIILGMACPLAPGLGGATKEVADKKLAEMQELVKNSVPGDERRDILPKLVCPNPCNTWQEYYSEFHRLFALIPAASEFLL